ncbi:class I SAM-dependent methyltransferase [Xanthovirga aplysinae]|uniref:class I SAM-dependent methyltransferase n=1 Tax=Xanthovirga aplysinae TaxID=2529853 RepID=UPI0012BC4F70|nr:class I SAM-dependent methyltransferase [Xanthovirga aplysinae]MTI33089.1 class I SAM-dependent methyltransferase [Xanthovirga aplysinae]
MEKELFYYDQLRKEMIDFLPNSIHRCIEFGCAKGRFSSFIKEKYKAESWGVDLDEDAIRSAERKLDRVLCGDALEMIEQLPDNYFDCLICNDFLEHLNYPDAFLRRIKKALKKDAYLVCSLPNVRYLNNSIEFLIKKDWQYKEAGILDYTHFRFFTKKSLERMLESCKLEIELIKGINPKSSLKSRFLLWSLNTLTMGATSDMRYLQFGVRARFT